MTQSLDARTIEQFSYFMTFFEHAYKLKEEGIVSRKLKAPDFDDFRSIKKRVAQVLLKMLRSSSVFDFPQTYEQDGQVVTLKAVSRWKKQEEELERYMRFILELDVERAVEDLIPFNEAQGVPEVAIIDNEVERDYFFEQIFETARGDATTEMREACINHFKEHYDIVMWKIEGDNNRVNNNLNRLTFLYQNPVGNIDQLDENITVNFRDCRLNNLQEFLKESGVHYQSRMGRINLQNLIKMKLYNSATDNHDELRVWMLEENANTRYYNNYSLVPCKIYKVNNFIEKLGDDNIFIPVRDNEHRLVNREQSGMHGMVCLAKRINKDGVLTTVPNQIRSTIRYDVRYTRDALMNPDSFFDLNMNLKNNIESRVTRPAEVEDVPF